MFHSDRGTQLTAAPFIKILENFNVVQSFPKKNILSIILVVSLSLNI